MKNIKNCPECLADFWAKQNKKYCSSSCQIVASKRQEWQKKKINPKDRVKQLCQMAKNRAKNKNLSFDITPEYLYELWQEQLGRCLVSGVEFDLRSPEQFNHCRWNAPSLDRINPKLGYTKGNVRLVCYQINAAIQHYGLEHFLDVCKTIVDYQGV